jgi:hypothetical protein
MSKGWTQKKLAEAVGCSQQYIAKMISKGLLPLAADGKIDGLKAVKIFEAHHAEVGKDDLREYNRTQKGRPKKKAAVSSVPMDDGGGGDNDDDWAKASDRASKVFNMAKAKEKKFLSLLRELEYKKAMGELIATDEVKADAENVAALLNALLAAMPSRIAPKLMQRDSLAEIQAIIEAEVNEVKKAIYESRFIS